MPRGAAASPSWCTPMAPGCGGWCTAATAAGPTNHPWFSSDSKSLVFTSDYAAVSAEPVSNPHHYQPYGEIYTVDIDGSNIRRLTHNSFEDGTPSWTPYFLDPRDVGETLQASGRCAFQDCHRLNIEDAQPEELIYGKSC
uniref:Uncharacterized protein n=1 Tax=Oryza glaberrima TaxID=4538 RepID=I1PJT6_ORYGL